MTVFRHRHPLDDERGSVVVVAGIVVLVMALLATVIIEVGQTMSHRRHLQVQADAAALAAAQQFPLCTTNPSSAYNSMATTADQYGGFGGPASFNQQAGSASGYAGTVERTYQSPDYPAAPSGYSQHAAENDPVFLNSDGSRNTDTTTLTCGNGTPSSTKMFDVKASEYGIHGVFSFGISSTVNAHARVELKAVNEATGLLPLAVPDVRPKFVFATFIDESTGLPIANCPNSCTEGLTKQPGAPADNQQTWAPSSGTELAVPVVAGHIGVRIRLVGADDPNLQCGQLYTQCYDASSANGVVHIRGWQSGTGPIAQNVWLLPGSGATACSPDAYFTQVACNAGIKAMLDLATTITKTNADPPVWATVDGGNTKYPLTPATTGTGTIEWDGSGIPISGDGPHNIELFYGTGKGTSLGVVQRAYVANPSGSGPLNLVQVYQPGVVQSGANSFKAGTSPTLGVVVKTTGNLLISQPTDPPIYLRLFNDSGSASQNQSLDCEPQGSPNTNLRDQIANGCTPWFKTQTSLTCPASTWNGMQALPQPWTCVGIQTGAKPGQVSQGLDLRIFNDATPPQTLQECQLHPVNWLRPDPANGITGGFNQTAHPDDRRVLPLFVTPLGTFQQTGGGVVPLIDFGYFYVTGYSGDPCQGNDPNQDPVPNNRAAYVRGHFIKYFPIDAQHHPSDDNCDFSTITPCVGVLTR